MSKAAESELYRVVQRSIAHQAIPMLFKDKEAEGIVRSSGYVPQKEPSLSDAFRTALCQEIIAEAIRAFLRKHPFGLVVQYECDLSLPFSLPAKGSQIHAALLRVLPASGTVDPTTDSTPPLQMHLDIHVAQPGSHAVSQL